VQKPDWLRELQVALVIGLVVIGALGVATVVTGLSDPLPVRVSAEGVSGSVGLRAGGVIAAEQELTVTVAGPSTAQRLWWLVTTLPTGLVIAILLVLLLRIVRHARRADPFTPATVRRLRVLAVVALAGVVLAFPVQLLGSMALSGTVLSDAVAGSAEFPAYWLLVGFGLFAVAEVVRRGCAMRTELAGVI
jgi:hypothetical protein